MKPYDHKKIEPKWQRKWEKDKIYQAKDFSKKPKFYSLIEFPFPSGEGMHAGHLRSNTAMDIISRKRRAEGYNVLYPIGWDAFGLPTENYAIKTGLHPKVVTKKNTDNFRKQLKSAGFSFDWSREINTSDPAYYKWTQWMFLQFYKHGMAYKKKMLINWCPKDKIGLANEEVINGRCERCGTLVEKREKEQWMLAITKYADRLDKDLDGVDYLEKIKVQQRNWIGKSKGAEIEFQVKHLSKNLTEKIKVFTTRPDTLFGATYLVVAPEHDFIITHSTSIINYEEVRNYIEQAKNTSDIDRTTESKDKTGIQLQGISAINPANQKEIPIFVADYVLGHYGTGAIMAVPAHDERDFDFAKKFKLPIIPVIVPHFIDDDSKPKEEYKTVARRTIYAILRNSKTDEYLCLDWQQFKWHTFIVGGVEEGEDIIKAAEREIREETGYKNIKFVKDIGRISSAYFAAHKKENRIADASALVFELTDESRDEPDVHETKHHNAVWIKKTMVSSFIDRASQKYAWTQYIDGNKPYTVYGHLINSGMFDGMASEEAKKAITDFVSGKLITTYKLRDWVFSRQRYWGEPIPIIQCDKCGLVPVSEKDLPVKLPDVKKYEPTETGESPLAAITTWVNTKCPQCKGPGKRETDTMPNWAGSSWYFLRYADPKNKKSFSDIKKLTYWMPVDWYNGGMEHTTLHLLYSQFWNKFLYDIKLVSTSEPYQKRTSHGIILAGDGEKMSKSRGNVVNPDNIIDTFGADSLRLYEMFIGPFDQAVSWTMDGIIGPRRFIERVWKMQEKVKKIAKKKIDLKNEVPKLEPTDYSEIESILNRTIKKVSEDMELMQFNTAVSALMILSNEMDKLESIPVQFYEIFVRLLAPIIPHVTEEIWSQLGHKKSIHLEKWLQFDPQKIVSKIHKLAVQINGKVRAEFSIEAEISEDEIKQRARTIPEIEKWIVGKEIKKIIYVKDKLVNIVVV